MGNDLHQFNKLEKLSIISKVLKLNFYLTSTNKYIITKINDCYSIYFNIN